MKKVNKVKIVFYEGGQPHPSAVYFAGSMITGEVSFQVNESIEVKAVKLKFKGKACVSWTEQVREEEEWVTKERKDKEKYFEKEVKLLKEENDDHIILNPGEQRFPFTFDLPGNLPSSFEAKKTDVHGYVRYYVKCKIDRPGDCKDFKITQPFTVLGILDLNLEGNVLQPNQGSETKMICCLCCATGPVYATFRTDRTGYVPGEAIRLDVELKNDSDRIILKSKVKLNLLMKFHADGLQKWKTEEIAKVEHGQTEPGGTDTWNGEILVIPPCPPSFLRGCKIINLSYTLTFTADVDNTPFDLDITFPIIIGNIPLRTFYMMPSAWGMMPQPADVPPGPPPMAVVDPNDVTLNAASSENPITSQPGSLPAAPPPTYQDCSYFTGEIKSEVNEGELTAGEFKPNYTYYNFGH